MLTTKQIKAGSANVPTECLADPPTPTSIVLSGVAISIACISRSADVDKTYVSRVFGGKRTPSIQMAKKMAAALGMEIGAFLSALEAHLAEKALHAFVEEYAEIEDRG